MFIHGSSFRVAGRGGMVTFDNNMARCGEINGVFKYRIESVALTSNLLKF